MRHTTVLAALLAACASAALSCTNAEGSPARSAGRTRRISSSSPTAGKHGDEICGHGGRKGRLSRESILLRGLAFETDETMRVGPDGMPIDVVVRGVTPSGDAAETFAMLNGTATWKSPVDAGTCPYSAPDYYLQQGGAVPEHCADRPVDRDGPRRDGTCSRPVAARIRQVTSLDVAGPAGPKARSTLISEGRLAIPQPLWLDETANCSAQLRRTGPPPGRL